MQGRIQDGNINPLAVSRRHRQKRDQRYTDCGSCCGIFCAIASKIALTRSDDL